MKSPLLRDNYTQGLYFLTKGKQLLQSSKEEDKASSLLTLNNYWFILGREAYISAAEILAVLRVKNYELTVPILKITIENLVSKDLIKKLGGTIKIAKEISAQATVSDIEKLIVDELKTVVGKINFGISLYSNEKNDFDDLKLAEALGKTIKKSLKAEGLSVRYVENREPVLSSVTVEKNNLTGRGREFIIEKHSRVSTDLPTGQAGGTRHDSAESSFSLAQTEAVQPFEEFSARDFGRPGRDDLSGMLPPKLAITMINLAQQPIDAVLLDPFCGSGTILTEAILLGYHNLIGTDVAEKAINDTEQNLNWTLENFSIPNQNLNIDLHPAGIENIHRVVATHSIDAIVTEPYLGKPLKGNEKREELLKQAAELKKLYADSFVQFAKILKPKGRVIFLIPRFRWQNEWVTIDCQKEIQQLGFKVLYFFEDTMPLVYARPNQRVAREIWGFEKT